MSTNNTYNQMPISADGIIIEQEYTSEIEESASSPNEPTPIVKESALDKISKWLLILFVFLLPIFFIPLPYYSLQQGKMFFLTILVSILLILFSASRMRAGYIELPWHKLTIWAFIIPLVFFISSILSPSFQTSLIGSGAETGTVLFVIICMSVLMLTALYIRSMSEVFAIYAAILTAFSITAIYQVTRLVMGFDTLSFGIFNSSVSNLVGKWNDFGAFTGFIVLLSLLSIELIQLKGLFKMLATTILAVALFFLILVDFGTIWIMLTTFTAFVMLYKTSLGRAKKRKKLSGELLDSNDTNISYKIPIYSAIVLIITLIFSVMPFIKSQFISSYLTKNFGISHLEARPSWGSTIQIASKSIQKNFIAGTGPNRFYAEWAMSKPLTINETPFWNVDFNAGIGSVPTFAVTTGLLGIFSFLGLMIILILNGVRTIFSNPDDPFAYYLSISSFFAAAYGWTIMIFYTPGVVPIILTYLFTGLFLSMLMQTGHVKSRLINFSTNPKSNFIFSSFLIVGGLFAIYIGYTYMNHLLSETQRQRAVLGLTSGNLNEDATIDMIKDSQTKWGSDRTYRDLADLYIRQLNSFLANNQGLADDEAIIRFREILSNAIENGRNATKYDSSNYANWIILGNVYLTIVPIGIEGAYENALSSYEKALELNPTNPSIYLRMARLETSKNNLEEARKRIADAIRIKNNYSEAVFFLTQLEIQAGNIEAATKAGEQASLLSPSDPLVFFQLGLLYYHLQDFNRAINSFERAVNLNNEYSNARYFLGLSYDRVDRRQDALEQFIQVEQFNPDNKEVKLIIENLSSNRAPFSNAPPPLDEPPEERDELPIDEN